MVASDSSFINELYSLFPCETEEERVRTSLGETIVEARTRLGISQKELANSIGLSVTQMNKIERSNKVKPNRQTLRLISSHLGLNYRELLIKCGYSDIRTRNSYYDKLGHEIDIESIADAIYAVNSDLLSELANISYVSTKDNLYVILLLLKAMLLEKKTASTDKSINSILEPLKKYIVMLLDPIVKDSLIERE